MVPYAPSHLPFTICAVPYTRPHGCHYYGMVLYTRPYIVHCYMDGVRTRHFTVTACTWMEGYVYALSFQQRRPRTVAQTQVQLLK